MSYIIGYTEAGLMVSDSLYKLEAVEQKRE